MRNIKKNANWGKKGGEFWGYLFLYFNYGKNVVKTTFNWRSSNDGGTEKIIIIILYTVSSFFSLSIVVLFGNIQKKIVPFYVQMVRNNMLKKKLTMAIVKGNF
jgi:hypothetical protein